MGDGTGEGGKREGKGRGDGRGGKKTKIKEGEDGKGDGR